MSQFFARMIRILFGVTLILMGMNRAAQAQALPPSEPPATAPPRPDEAAPSPATNKPSTNKPEPEKPTTDQPRRRRWLRPQIGIGGNIGITGNTSFSRGGVAVFNRMQFNDYLSLRSTNVFFSGERRDSSVALTFSMPIRSSFGDVRVAPFVGGGALISSKGFFDEMIVRGLVTSGIDIPISMRITATGAVNVGFTDRPNMGVQLGVMYRF
jgi:hypothetical protein